MNIESIQAKLTQLGYSKSNITVMNKRQIKMIIPGEVHVQQIKDSFDVSKWEYNEQKIEFVVEGIKP